MDSLYQERIVDHFRRPRRQGVLVQPDLSAELDNPVCGDVVRFDVLLVDGKVTDARWSGRGCVLCVASASMLAEALQGKTVQEMQALEDEDMFDLLGFRPGLVRSRCALLPLRALQEALAQFEA
jgi:nitrogen fixation NifU-like protein